MEYKQTKRFRESLCGVANVTIFCDERKLCTCAQTNIDPCAKVDVKYYGDPQVNIFINYNLKPIIFVKLNHNKWIQTE